MTSERVQASTQREHPTRRDIPTEGGDADAPLIREIQEPQVTALKRRVKFDWRPLDEALGYLVEIRLEDRRRVTAWGRSGHVELKTGSEPGRYLLVAREFEAGNGAGVLCTASYEQQGQIPGALPRSQILAAIGVAVAAVAGLLALGWSFLVAGDDADPWQWFVSSLGVAILLSLATSVIGFGLAAQPLTRPVDTRDAKLWSLNGSWLTNLAFIGLAVAAVVGKDGAFLSALSSDEKLVAVVSLIVFAAIAGSAGLIAQLDTRRPDEPEGDRRLTTGGLLATSFLVMLATYGNLSMVACVVYALGNTTVDKPLSGAWLVFILLLAGAGVAAGGYTAITFRDFGKSPVSRHPAMQ